MPQVKRLREQFGIKRMVMVGDRGDPPAYLRRAVINHSTSWLRRLIRERRHVDGSTLDDVVWHDSDGLAVADTVRRLSPRQRAAVVLRYVDGLSEAEIATALGCRPGTVKSLLSREHLVESRQNVVQPARRIGVLDGRHRRSVDVGIPSHGQTQPHSDATVA